MTTSRTREATWFGTDEPVQPPLLLQAGPLTAELEDGNLRYISLHGREMLRAVSYLVRDRNWATYRPVITGLDVVSEDGGFTVRYAGRVADASQALTYDATIVGRSDGSLSFTVSARAESAFLTNRAGFVVLHPIEGVAGGPVTVEEVDGRIVETRFPELIDPVQPFKSLRALTHAFADGHRVTCRMEGDTFEMEDQRNWLDASFKTYVRPLALPWPYEIGAGQSFEQRVSLSVERQPGATLAPPQEGAALSRPAETDRHAPALGFGLEARHARATADAAAHLSAARPRRVVCLAMPGAGAETLRQQFDAAAAVGAEIWLEAVIGSVGGYREEIAALARDVAATGHRVATLLVTPEADLKSTSPGSAWPPAPPAADLYRAARDAFPGVRLGGGMSSYFTELNRKRPALDDLDLVSFTTSSIVHSADDRSVLEGVEALPTMIRSARSFCGSKPLHVGPSAIGMRMNPYGAGPVDNPAGGRVAMARWDPRQDGLLGAAWALAYVARLARAGVSEITLGGGVGEFGLLRSSAGGGPVAGQGTFRPVFHVVRGLSALAGLPLADVTPAPGRDVQALCARTPSGLECWLANLTGGTLPVRVWGEVSGTIAVLDADTAEAAAGDPAFMDRTRPFAGSQADLPPYAVARMLLA